jgi:triosephosphate isomerase
MDRSRLSATAALRTDPLSGDLQQRRATLIAANWKMYKTPAEAVAFVESFRAIQLGDSHVVETLLFPAMTSLSAVTEAARGTRLEVGAQDMHWLDEGAYTGETSPTMLLALGCTHVLIGHSERRRYFNETDETVNRKLLSALAHGLIPVVCVGETKDERAAGATAAVLERQVSAALRRVELADGDALIFAYEPLWAIGDGSPAAPALTEDAHTRIRANVASVLGAEVAQRTRILYGGSVDAENAPSLLDLADVDGALVGGASLEPQSFAAIVRTARFRIAAAR